MPRRWASRIAVRSAGLLGVIHLSSRNPIDRTSCWTLGTMKETESTPSSRISVRLRRKYSGSLFEKIPRTIPFWNGPRRSAARSAGPPAPKATREAPSTPTSCRILRPRLLSGSLKASKKPSHLEGLNEFTAMTPGRQRSFFDDFHAVALGAAQTVPFEDLPGLRGRTLGDREADLPQSVHRKGHHGVRDMGRDLAGNAVAFEKAAHQLGFGVVPGSENDMGAQTAPLL